MTELVGLGTSIGVGAPGTAEVEDWPICVAPGRPTTGVDEARLDEGVEDDLSAVEDDLSVVEDDLTGVLEEIRAVLLGSTPMPPAALLVVFPASG